MKRLLLVLCLLGCGARAEDLAIIVAKTLPLENVSLADLTRILRCERTTGPDGTKLIVVMRERGSTERNAILSGVYRLSDPAYEKFFMQAVFTGTLAAAPRLVSDAAAMKKLAAKTPGVIGYVRAREADATVKIVKIDGLAPGEPNYPLKLAAN